MGKKIMEPEDVPPVGSVVMYRLDNGGVTYSVVVETAGFGAAVHLGGCPEIFPVGSRNSTIGCYTTVPEQWPGWLCVEVAKWRLTQ